MLPTFLNELLLLEPLVFTGIALFLCTSYPPLEMLTLFFPMFPFDPKGNIGKKRVNALCTHPTHYFKVNCKTNNFVIIDNTIYLSTYKFILVHTTRLSCIIIPYISMLLKILSYKKHFFPWGRH